jgi:hypothetical protein
LAKAVLQLTTDDQGKAAPTYVELPGRLRLIIPTRRAEIMAGGLRSSQ